MGKLLISLAAITSLLGGCGMLTAHRIDIQQGNAVSAAEVARLAPGMTMDQVRYVMGTSLLHNPFRADRWDYVYQLRHGRTGMIERRRASVFFDGNIVTHIETEGIDPPSATDPDDGEHAAPVPD